MCQHRALISPPWVGVQFLEKIFIWKGSSEDDLFLWLTTTKSLLILTAVCTQLSMRVTNIYPCLPTLSFYLSPPMWKSSFLSGLSFFASIHKNAELFLCKSWNEWNPVGWWCGEEQVLRWAAQRICNIEACPSTPTGPHLLPYSDWGWFPGLFLLAGASWPGNGVHLPASKVSVFWMGSSEQQGY